MSKTGPKYSGPDDKPVAEACGVDERTVRNWRKKDGAPNDGKIEDWLKFQASHGLGRGASKTKTELQEEKLREEIALLRLKRSREEGATVLVADVREFLGQLSAKHAQLLRMKYDTELPAKLAGKDMVEIRATIAGTTDEVGDIVSRGLLGWNPDS